MKSPNIKNHKKELKLLCINSKYGNFTVGKTYIAKAFATMLNGMNIDFKINDDDHDLYTIQEKHLIENKKLYFQIVS